MTHVEHLTQIHLAWKMIIVARIYQKTFQPETLVNFDGYALHDAVREDYVQPFNSVGVHLQEPIFLHG